VLETTEAQSEYAGQHIAARAGDQAVVIIPDRQIIEANDPVCGARGVHDAERLDLEVALDWYGRQGLQGAQPRLVGEVDEPGRHRLAVKVLTAGHEGVRGERVRQGVLERFRKAVTIQVGAGEGRRVDSGLGEGGRRVGARGPSLSGKNVVNRRSRLRGRC